MPSSPLRERFRGTLGEVDSSSSSRIAENAIVSAIPRAVPTGELSAETKSRMKKGGGTERGRIEIDVSSGEHFLQSDSGIVVIKEVFLTVTANGMEFDFSLGGRPATEQISKEIHAVYLYKKTKSMCHIKEIVE